MLTAFVLAACGTPAAAPAPEAFVPQDSAPAAAATQAPAAPPAKAAAGGSSAAGSNAIVDAAGGTAVPDLPQPQSDRKIIKNAELKLQVTDTDNAIDGSTQIVGDVGGYILSSRVWY
jgi:hypothetical protein